MDSLGPWLSMVRLTQATSPLLQMLPVSLDKLFLLSLIMVPTTLLSLVDPTRRQVPSWPRPTPGTPSLSHGKVLILPMCVFSLCVFSFVDICFFKWPHNTGPMLTYMANCGSVTCDKFDITNAKWFKIQQIGRKTNGGDWAQADLSRFPPIYIYISFLISSSGWWLRNSFSP